MKQGRLEYPAFDFDYMATKNLRKVNDAISKVISQVKPDDLKAMFADTKKMQAFTASLTETAKANDNIGTGGGKRNETIAGLFAYLKTKDIFPTTLPNGVTIDLDGQAWKLSTGASVKPFASTKDSKVKVIARNK